MNASYVKIDCSQYSTLVEEQKKDNPWSETNLYSNIAIAVYLGLDPHKVDIQWPPKGVSVKSTSIETSYPELKEKIGGKEFKSYVLSSVDTKKKEVYLEGWIDYENLTKEKNLFKNFYVVSYKDLFPMSSFKC